MKIEGLFVVRAPRDLVWRSIRDPHLVAPCIPGCRDVEIVDPKTYKAILAISFGPIKAAFNLVIEILDEIDGDMIRTSTKGEEGSRASIVASENILKLDDALGGTSVAYSSNVQLTGRLAKFGFSVMKKRASLIAEEFAVSFGHRLAAMQMTEPEISHAS